MTKPNKPQNMYDNPDFLAGYSTLERFGEGWEKAGERDDLLGLLPDVTGLRVLDLGCGAGQLSRYLAEQGAASVVGVDLSEKMLALAREKWAHPSVTYQRDALETAAFQPASFDLVVSSLAFHYVEDYAALVSRIADWLTPGGVLVYSTEHPIFTGRLPGDGWVSGDDGPRWAVDRYATEELREENWFVDGVRKAHRTFATFINGLVDAGLAVERVIEPVASEQWIKDHPDWPDEWRRPTFLLVRARKS
ncbi:MAG: class I SAM-dependent methyltransferase [Chloroflexi bacterium]|nr:class I SAM-dependent methyltransferase [Chloroflexota bacterium]